MLEHGYGLQKTLTRVRKAACFWRSWSSSRYVATRLTATLKYNKTVKIKKMMMNFTSIYSHQKNPLNKIYR